MCRDAVVLTSGWLFGSGTGLLNECGIQGLWDLPESVDDSLYGQQWIPNEGAAEEGLFFLFQNMHAGTKESETRVPAAICLRPRSNPGGG